MYLWQLTLDLFLVSAMLMIMMKIIQIVSDMHLKRAIITRIIAHILLALTLMSLRWKQWVIAKKQTIMMSLCGVLYL